MDSKRDAKILALYQEGQKIKEIAAAVGMAPNSMVSILRRLGIERPSKPQKRWRGSNDDCDKIRELWGHGLCVSQIAERIGASKAIVARVVGNAGLSSKEHPRRRYDQSSPGGPGKSGFAGAMAKRT